MSPSFCSCRFLPPVLLEAFEQLHGCGINRRSLSSPSTEDTENLASDFDEEREIIILAIRSRAAAKAKLRGKVMLTRDQSGLRRGLSWQSGVLEKVYNEEEGKKEIEEEEEDDSFFTGRSCFSCSSNVSRSADSIKKHTRTRLVMEEFCNCQGWPFGLYRQSMMLPSLPQSPSESWSWCGGPRMLKMV